MQRNGGQEEHVKERVAKAVAMMGQVWGIGKRFGKDWKRRGGDLGLEGEGGCGKTAGEVFKVGVRGRERETPRYMVREELQREKLRMKEGKRAWAFEERLNDEFRGMDGGKRQFYEDRGVELESWQRGELEGERVWDELWERDRELQRVERWEKIRITKYNRYGWVKGEGVPEYLRKGWGRGDGEGWLDLD
ncbi:hypothetical protein ALC57_16973 [Trachymyrmex cornetzi]|uniref:Uncharacterized protein n=1 Tax=Trachymyrmex cornetzi TaxID=471704 RepID=A0A151IU21_9HYME|nr:hypothetical protein ALC57_16973 [Trachymyrmex cornetzi]